jgi:hypothetical protein
VYVIAVGVRSGEGCLLPMRFSVEGDLASVSSRAVAVEPIYYESMGVLSYVNV